MFCFSSLDIVCTLQLELIHIWTSGVTQAGLVLHAGADFIHAACLQDGPDLCGGWSHVWEDGEAPFDVFSGAVRAHRCHPRLRRKSSASMN